MRKQKVPCYNCQRRTHCCHSSCEDYKAYRQWLDEKNQRIRHGKEEERLLRNDPVDHYDPPHSRKKADND